MAACVLQVGCQMPARVEVGQNAPPFAATSLEGTDVSLSDYPGDVILLSVWATWCQPCRREMPAFEMMHREQEKSGLRVVAVSVDPVGGRPDIEDFLREYDITFAVLHDPAQNVARTYQTAGVPETFLIGRDGRLLRRWIGRIDPLSPSIRAQVDAALAEGV